MSSGSSCHFCASTNPAGSKFCNDCGEPLDLKPCRHCDAFNHVAVDRCYQCGTPFAAKQEALAVPEPTTAGSVPEPTRAGAPDSVGAARAHVPRAPRPARVEPTPDPLERVPVALSDRMEASTERVAEHPGDAPPPLMPFAEAPDPDGDADVDWVDPRRERAARRDLRVRRRAHAAYAAAAAVILCAVGAAGYVAYDSGFLSPATDWARTAGREIVAASAAMIGEVRGERPDASATPAAPVGGPSKGGIAQSGSATTSSGATSVQGAGEGVRPGAPKSVAANPAERPAAPPIAPPPAEAPAPLATKTLGDTSKAPAASAHGAKATTGAARGAPGEPTEPASKSPRSVRKDPAHLIARQAPPRSSAAVPAQPHVDRDALATQRLIERDLAGFLPHPPAEQPPAR